MTGSPARIRIRLAPAPARSSLGSGALRRALAQPQAMNVGPIGGSIPWCIPWCLLSHIAACACCGWEASPRALRCALARAAEAPRRRQCAPMRSAARQPRSSRADPPRSYTARRIRHRPPPSRWQPSPGSDSDPAHAGTGALLSRIRRAQACFGSAAGNECRARWRKHPLVYPLVSAESHHRLRKSSPGVAALCERRPRLGRVGRAAPRSSGACHGPLACPLAGFQ